MISEVHVVTCPRFYSCVLSQGCVSIEGCPSDLECHTLNWLGDFTAAISSIWEVK